jgi:hypothetical protein
MGKVGGIIMNIRTEIRQLESHVKTLATTRTEQVAIISKAQSMATTERQIAILAIVKRRIIK